jgi:ABC transporter substrate binding protein
MSTLDAELNDFGAQLAVRLIDRDRRVRTVPPIGLSPRPRDGIVVSSLHCMNDPQAEGHMASHIGRRKFLATLGGAAAVQRFAKELVALQPDLILSQSTPTTAALLQHTRTIPIIFANIADPVGSGFVASFPRPAATPPDSSCSSRRWPASGWSCSRRLRRASTGSPSCSTRQRRHILNITRTPSKPPLHPSAWRRLQHLFTTGPNSNLRLPHRHASRMAALSCCRIPF